MGWQDHESFRVPQPLELYLWKVCLSVVILFKFWVLTVILPDSVSGRRVAPVFVRRSVMAVMRLRLCEELCALGQLLLEEVGSFPRAHSAMGWK